MEAILLAGGLGTRLREAVSDRPKPMASVLGRPFLEYLVRELAFHGIADIVFAVGYKGGMVEEHFGDGTKFGFHARYSYEEELLGTAGAVKNAGRLLREDRFFVLNGDTFYRMDYQKLWDLCESGNLDMGLVVREVPDVSRYGRAVLKDGLLVSFNEKTESPKPGAINGGVYCMKRKLLEEIPEGKVSLEQDMIPRWLASQRVIGGMAGRGYFIDIGIPRDYYQFVEDVEKGVISW